MNLYFIDLLSNCEPEKRERIRKGKLPNGNFQCWRIEKLDHSWSASFYKNGNKHGLCNFGSRFKMNHRRRESPFFSHYEWMKEPYFFDSFSSQDFNFLL